MTTKRRRKKKYRWLSKIKRRCLAFITRKTTDTGEQPLRIRKRRTRRRKKQKSLQELWQSFVVLFKGIKGQKRRRRSKRKSLWLKIYRSWLKLPENMTQWLQKPFSFQKRRRRRRRKQYALYVMGNQKKVD
jgi:hypothetical protein